MPWIPIRKREMSMRNLPTLLIFFSIMSICSCNASSKQCGSPMCQTVVRWNPSPQELSSFGGYGAQRSLVRRRDIAPICGHHFNPHRLEDQKDGESRDDVHRAGDEEHGVPATRPLRQDIPQRDQKRRRSLGSEDESVVSGGVLGAEDIGAKRRKQTVDLAPGEEHQSGEEHESERIRTVLAQRPDTHSLEQEGDEHGVFSPEDIGDPAEQRSRHAVQHTSERERESQV